MRIFSAFLLVLLLPFCVLADFYKIADEGQVWTDTLTNDFLSTYKGVEGGKFTHQFGNKTSTVGRFYSEFTFDSDVEILNASTDAVSTGSNMFHARFNVENGTTLTLNKSFLLNAKIKTRIDFRSDDINKFGNVVLKSNIDITGGVSQDNAELWLQNINFTYQAKNGIANSGYTHFFNGAKLIVKNCELTTTTLAIRNSTRFENDVRQRGTIVADGAVVIFNWMINQDVQDGVFKFEFKNGGTFWFKHNLATLIAEGSSVAFENMKAGDVIKSPDNLTAEEVASSLTINGESVKSLIDAGFIEQTYESGFYTYTFLAKAAKPFYTMTADKEWSSTLPAYFLKGFSGFNGETFKFYFVDKSQTVGMFDKNFIFDCPVFINNQTTTSSMWHAIFSLNEAATIQFNKSFLLKSDIKTRIDFRSEGSQKFGTVILKEGVNFEGEITQDQCEFWLHRVNFIYNAENKSVNMGYTHFENAPNVIAKDCSLTMTTLAIRTSNVALGSYFELGTATVDNATFTVRNWLNQSSYAGEFHFKFERGGSFVFDRNFSVLTDANVIIRFESMNKGDVIKTVDDISAQDFSGKITVNGQDIADLISSGVLKKTSESGKFVFTYTNENKNLLLSASTSNLTAGNAIQFSVSSDEEVRTFVLMRNGVACKAQQSTEFDFVEDIAGNNQYTVMAIFPDGSTSTTSAVAVNVGKINKFFVSPSGSDSNKGTSWDNAFATIECAMSNASAVASEGIPAEVWIEGGTYLISTPLKLSAGVQLYGGFAGNEKSLSERVEGNETILCANNSNRIFENIFSEDVPLTNVALLERLTFTSGYSNENGGAIYNSYASPTISNCKFTNNNCDLDGGAIYEENSNSVITNCSFSKNQSSCGAAIGGYKSTTKIKQCNFSENIARSAGGAIYTDRGAISVSMCKFTKNTATYGGAIYTDSTYASIENSQMSFNKANFAGAVYCCSSWPTLMNLTADNNVVSADAGAFYCDLGSPSITNCTITNNTTYADGGAIYLRFASSKSIINNCTIFANTTSGCGGAIVAENASLPTIKNSILWDNSSSDNLQIAQFDTLANPNVENCIVQGGVEYGTRIVDASPELLSLADNGGYIQTCALSGGSVAIAKCTTADSFPSTDARCFTRNTTACLGAYEYLPIAISENPQGADIFQGDSTSLNVSVESDFATLQWQVSVDGGITWQDVKDATSSVLKVADLTASTKGYIYRCKVSQPQRDTTYSAPATITVWQNTTFGHWAFENNLRGERGGENAKPFFDNISNLERFVFGFPLNKPSSYAENTMFKYVSTSQEAGIVFPVRKSATDVKVVAKFSVDVQNWQSVEAEKIGELGDFDLYQAKVDISDKDKIFFKVEVSQ